MKTRKRFLSIVLMLAMLVSMFTVMAFAEDDSATVNDSGSVTVNVVIEGNGTGNVKLLTNGGNVVKIGSESFNYTFNADALEGAAAVASADANCTAKLYYDGAVVGSNAIDLSDFDQDVTLKAVFTKADGEEDLPEKGHDLTLKIENGGVKDAKVLGYGTELPDGFAITLFKGDAVEFATQASEDYTVVWKLGNKVVSEKTSYKLDTTLTENTTLTVTFTKKAAPAAHTLTVSANRASRGYIKCGSDKGSSITKELVKNEKYTFEAVAKSGYKFSYWKSDDITISDADKFEEELTITMPDKNAAVTAVFVEKSSTSCSHSYVENYNDTYHWKECKYCGAVKSGSKEKHDLYSYKKNGYTYKYCVDCDYDSYTYDYDKHPSSHDSYVYTDLNASYHLKECAKKGCSYEVKEYHTWIKNTDRKTKDSYPYVCKYCDRLSKTAYTDLPFRDVDDSVWYYDDVLYAYINGYMDGLSAGQFAPNQNTTRAQIVTILWRLTGEPRATKSNKFSDVSSSAYYDKAVSWAVEAGVVNGFDAKTFKPNDYVTREQLAAILYRYAEYMNVSTRGASNLTKYDDYYQIGTWARDAMAWANYHGLINGVSYTRIDPKGNATRAQVAAILHRFAVEFGNY